MDYVQRIVLLEFCNTIVSITVGGYLCFGALKWPRKLISLVALYWGIALGLLIGITFGREYKSGYIIVGCVLIGAIVFPILAYTVPAVNRFVIGFIVAMKLTFMVCTVFMKNGTLYIWNCIQISLIVAIGVGIILMLWKQMSISAFVLVCAFLGASQIAPEIGNLINEVDYVVNGGIPIDLFDIFFSFFGIELTDTWTMIFMFIFMGLGICSGYIQLKKMGVANDMPLIVYYAEKFEDN